jgi:hypothetical protein
MCSRRFPGVEVRWLVRGDRARGEALAPAGHAALCELGIAAPAAGVDPEDVHLQGGMPWEAPETGADGYAWRGRGREGPEAAAPAGP